MMKTRWREIVLLGFLLAFAVSCSPYRAFFIEVREPAAVTIPMKYDRLLVVNNAVPQPSNVGLSRAYDGELITSPPLAIDSVPWLITNAFARQLGNSEYFSQVDIYTKALREDGEFLSVLEIPQEQRKLFFRDYDAILSVDRVLLRGYANVNQFRYFSENTFMSAELIFLNNINVYYNDVDTVAYHFSYRDSVDTKVTLRADSARNMSTDVEAVIKKISSVVAAHAANQFIPSWQTNSRIIFIGSNSDMRRADVYAKGNNWEQAEALWLELDSTTTKAKAKAHLAHNLAVAYEMQDRFKEAVDRITKAEAYYIEAKIKEDHPDVILARNYKKELTKRFEDEKKLSIQVGSISLDEQEDLFEN